MHILYLGQPVGPLPLTIDTDELKSLQRLFLHPFTGLTLIKQEPITRPVLVDRTEIIKPTKGIFA